MSQVIEDKSIGRLESQPIGKLLLSYALPAVVGMVAASLYNIVDRIFIGQGVGAMAISGLTLTFPLMAVVTAVGTLVGVGAAARTSILLGMKKVERAKNILGNAVVLTFILSAITITFSMLYLDDILRLFGGSDQTIPYAKDYLKIVIPGTILMNLSYSFSNIMRASGFPKKSMFAMLIGVGINVILDPIFIFGLGWGIRGAAIATVISMAVSATYVASHFFNKKHPIHLTSKALRLKKYIILQIVSIGMAPFLMNLAASFVNVAMNHHLVRYGGDLAMGAYGIIGGYAMFLVMLTMGLCQGMQPIVGYSYGARKYKRMKDALLLTLKVATGVMIVGFVLGQLIPTTLIRAFTTDPELMAIASQGLRIVFLMLPVVGFQIVVSVFFQSISKAKTAAFIGLTRQVLFLIPLLFILSHFFGLKGVWFALPCSDISAALLALFFLYSEKRKLYPRAQERMEETK